MKKEKKTAKLLKLWKARQEAQGIDTSGVNTLAEAERFYDKPKKAEKAEEDGQAESAKAPQKPNTKPKAPKKGK